MIDTVGKLILAIMLILADVASIIGVIYSIKTSNLVRKEAINWHGPQIIGIVGYNIILIVVIILHYWDKPLNPIL